MRVGISLIVVAIGATLTWAVTATVGGVDIHAVGVILFAVGLLGLLVSLVLAFAHESWGPRGPRPDDRDDLGPP